jgi:hypothetical protein
MFKDSSRIRGFHESNTFGRNKKIESALTTYLSIFESLNKIIYTWIT